MRHASLSRNDIVERLFRSDDFAQVLKKVPVARRDDIRQEAMIVLLNKDDDTIIDSHKNDRLRSFAAAIVYKLTHNHEDKTNRQYRQSTEIPFSNFCEEKTDTLLAQKSYNSHESEQGEIDYEELLESCQVHTDKLYWYYKDIMIRYARLGTFRAVSTETGIPVSSIYEAVKKARHQIKEDLWG